MTDEINPLNFIGKDESDPCSSCDCCADNVGVWYAILIVFESVLRSSNLPPTAVNVGNVVHSFGNLSREYHFYIHNLDGL